MKPKLSIVVATVCTGWALLLLVFLTVCKCAKETL